MINDISEEVWRIHFMKLLEGKEKNEEKRIGREEDLRHMERQKEEELGNSEIEDAVKRMKIKKASGIDGIPIEAWLYAGKGVRRSLVKLLKQIWKEGNIPNDWKMSITVTLYKRGDREVTSNYR